MKKVILLLLLTLFSCSNKNNFWNNKSEVFGNWIKLERDNKGYLIYNPCNGNNNFININNDFAIFNLSQELPDTLKVNDIKVSNSLREIVFSTTHEFYNINSSLKIIDFDKKLYLLKWKLITKSNNNIQREGKMMVTKSNYSKSFRLINNPCNKEKTTELKFLPIEYE